jgi:hypothetical protein
MSTVSLCSCCSQFARPEAYFAAHPEEYRFFAALNSEASFVPLSSSVAAAAPPHAAQQEEVLKDESDEDINEMRLFVQTANFV